MKSKKKCFLGFVIICAVILVVKIITVNRRKRESGSHTWGIYEKYIKRIQDFILAFIALIILFPIMLIVAVLVRIKLGSPILFIQERPGLNGKIFKLYKFRTMTDRCGTDGRLLSDEERLTDFGRKLRNSSLDELPELFNILKGNMSFVGPRPLLVEYLPLYNAYQARRHEVRPGLTGLAQVSGRNSLSWDEKLGYDAEYVDYISFWKDWMIMFKTIAVVLKHAGIHSDTSATMEVFMGNEEI